MEINISYNEFWDEPWPLCLLPCLNLCVQDVYWARVIVHVLQPLDPHSQRFTPQDGSADQNIRIVILFKFQFPSLPSTGHLINDAVLVKILEFFDTWCMNHISLSVPLAPCMCSRIEKSLISFYPGTSWLNILAQWDSVYSPSVYPEPVVFPVYWGGLTSQLLDVVSLAFGICSDLYLCPIRTQCRDLIIAYW